MHSTVTGSSLAAFLEFTKLVPICLKRLDVGDATCCGLQNHDDAGFDAFLGY